MAQVSSNDATRESREETRQGNIWSTSRRGFVQALSAIFVSPNQILNFQSHGTLANKLIKELTANEKGQCTELLFEGLGRLCAASENFRVSFAWDFGGLPLDVFDIKSAVEGRVPRSASEFRGELISISKIKSLAADYNELTNATGLLRSLPIWGELQALIKSSNMDLIKRAKLQFLTKLSSQFKQEDRHPVLGSNLEVNNNELLFKKFVDSIETATSEEFFFDDLEDYFLHVTGDWGYGEESCILDELVHQSQYIIAEVLDQASRIQAANENKILRDLGLTPSAIERFNEMFKYNLLTRFICSRPKAFLPEISGNTEVERKLAKFMGESSNIFDVNALRVFQEQLVEHVGNSISEYNCLLSQLRTLHISQSEGNSSNSDLNHSLSDKNSPTKNLKENCELEKLGESGQAQEKESHSLTNILSQEFFESGYQIVSLDGQEISSQISIARLISLANKLQLKVLESNLINLQNSHLNWDEINILTGVSNQVVLLICDVPTDYRLGKITTDKINRDVILGALFKGDLLVFDPNVFTCKVKPGSLANGGLGILYVEQQ